MLEEYKKCARCHNKKPLEEFEPLSNKRCKRCVECGKRYYHQNKEKRREYAQDYYKENRERLIKHNAEYHKQNPEVSIKSAKKWRKNNKEKSRWYVADWAKRNPHKRTEAVARRRQRIRYQCDTFLSDDDLQKIREIYKECDALNKSTEETWHVDHIVPVNGKNVCGLHVPWNLRIITATENLEKSNKLDEEIINED